MHADSFRKSRSLLPITPVLASVALLVSTLGCSGDTKQPTTPVSTSDKPMDASPPTKPGDTQHPVVRIETDKGPITLKLDGVSAPGTVRNFLNYASEGFYDNTIIHYVAPSKMIVAGGYTTDRQPKSAGTPIRNEAHNGLRNLRGTIAMTRDPSVIDSATSQFFINLEDAPQRDHQGDTADTYGYCVFGNVTGGLEVADKISQSPTTTLSGDLAKTPDPPIIINSIRVVQ